MVSLIITIILINCFTVNLNVYSCNPHQTLIFKVKILVVAKIPANNMQTQDWPGLFKIMAIMMVSKFESWLYLYKFWLILFSVAENLIENLKIQHNTIFRSNLKSYVVNIYNLKIFQVWLFCLLKFDWQTKNFASNLLKPPPFKVLVWLL